MVQVRLMLVVHAYCHRSNVRVKSDDEDWFALVIALLHVSEPSAGTCPSVADLFVWNIRVLCYAVLRHFHG